MKEYLLLFRGGFSGLLHESPGEWQIHMKKWMKWMRDLEEKGKLISAQPLEDSGKLLMGQSKALIDGPFLQGDKIVSGYLSCRVKNMDEAIEIAKVCPILDFENGMVEIRATLEVKM